MTERHDRSDETRNSPLVSEPSSSAGDTGTLGKTIALVELVCSADQSLRFTDILRLTGQPRGSLHRQLKHLVLEGLLELSPDGTYTAGLRLLHFASKAWAHNSARKVAEPHLRHLQELTGETVHFGALRGTEIIYLDKLESRQAVRMHSQVGNASPVYCTGIGKAALSTLEDERVRQLARALSPLRRKRLWIRKRCGRKSAPSAPRALPMIGRSISRESAVWQPPSALPRGALSEAFPSLRRPSGPRRHSCANGRDRFCPLPHGSRPISPWRWRRADSVCRTYKFSGVK